MRSVPTQDLERVTERVFDVTSLLAEHGCDDQIERAVDEVLKIFAGEKSKTVIRCRNGVRVTLEKTRFGLKTYVEEG